MALQRNLFVVPTDDWAFAISVKDGNDTDFDFTDYTATFTVTTRTETITGTIVLATGLITLSLDAVDTAKLLNERASYTVRLTTPTSALNTLLLGDIGEDYASGAFELIIHSGTKLKAIILDDGQPFAASAAASAASAAASAGAAVGPIVVTSYISGVLPTGRLKGGKLPKCSISAHAMEVETAPSGGTLVLTFRNIDDSTTAVFTFNDGSTTPDSVATLPIAFDGAERFEIEVTSNGGSAAGLFIYLTGDTVV